MVKLSILDDKNAFFDRMIIEFDKEFAIYQGKLNKLIAKFIESSPKTHEEVRVFLKGSGLDGLIAGFVAKYDGILQYTKELSLELGIPFVLPKPAFAVMQLIKESAKSKIFNASNEIMNTLVDASLRYGIGEVRLPALITELQSVITTAGRRIATEAFTSASMYDRSIKFMQYQQLEVKKFFYAGPVDSLNRDICADVLSSPLQGSGWTMDDIESSGAGFISGGGYNCRHEWLPFVEGADALLDEMKRDAGLL